MKIGIDASRAFLKKRTGIEEYSFQVIKNLRDKLKNVEVTLYIRPRGINASVENFDIPKNWKIQKINFPIFWTQIGLSLEMLIHPVDVLFIPAHTVPIIHPRGFIMDKLLKLFYGKNKNFKTVVTVHGLEYEFLPEAYSLWERIYMRQVIKKSCRWANKIIAVSYNTKNDLINLYKVPDDKIEVIYEGCSFYESNIKNEKEEVIIKENQDVLEKYQIKDVPYLLFLGRIEERKNMLGIIKAFAILKRKYSIPHKLVLAGGFGYRYSDIVKYIQNNDFKDDIYLTGFIDEKDKKEILKNADVFLFPTLYEGFGLPIIEAQSLGVPIVASNNSSIPEIVGEKNKASLVDPNNPEEIAQAVFNILSDKDVRDNIVNPGLENVKRFSWNICAQEVARVLLK
ncbi:MAG: glycosyltransferase family 1 protein [Parcubacteria group bacterium]|jgi:glycosyltransferase involved in cell wall biosynthesis